MIGLVCEIGYIDRNETISDVFPALDEFLYDSLVLVDDISKGNLVVFDLAWYVECFLFWVGKQEESGGKEDDKKEGDHQGYEDGKYNFEFHINWL